MNWKNKMGCGLLFGALLAGFSSCEMKNELWGKDPNELSPEESGILDLKLEIKEPTYNNIDTAETRAATSMFVVPTTAELEVKVFDETQELYEYFESYAEYEKLSEYMVKAGTYYIEVSSGENYEVTTDHPYYATRDTAQVKVKEVSTINAVCELQSAILYLVPSDEFLNACLDDYSITVTNGSGILSIRKDDPKIVYVRPGMKATVTIRATEKNTNTPVIRTFVLAGEDGSIHEQDLFKVEIKDLEEDTIPEEPVQPDPTPEPEPEPEPTPEPEPEPEPEPDPEPEKPTNGNFTIKVDVTVNENPIDIVVPNGGGNGGNIGGSGGSDDNTGGDNTGDNTTTPGGDTDDDGGSDAGVTISGDALTGPLSISAPNGISSMSVQISSTNSEFTNAIAGMGLTSFDLANMSSELETVLVGLGLVDGSVQGKTSVSFNVTGLLGMLSSFDGTHTFSITVTDTKGNSQSTQFSKTI